MVFKVRDWGITNYKAIKVLISRGLIKLDDNGVVLEKVEYEYTSFYMTDDKLQAAINMLSEMMSKNIQEMVSKEVGEAKTQIPNHFLLIMKY